MFKYIDVGVTHKNCCRSGCMFRQAVYPEGKSPLHSLVFCSLQQVIIQGCPVFSLAPLNS